MTGALDDEVVAAMTEAINDEHRAQATYRAVIAKIGSVRPFSNIVRSEGTHIAALANLFNRYGAPVTADCGIEPVPLAGPEAGEGHVSCSGQTATWPATVVAPQETEEVDGNTAEQPEWYRRSAVSGAPASLGAAGTGACAMCLLDPERGDRRRALLRDQPLGRAPSLPRRAIADAPPRQAGEAGRNATK